MTTELDIANKVLQTAGIQKKLFNLGQDSAEAVSISLIMNDLRDDLLRKAPWTFALRTVNLNYITSAPGTPENTSAATTLWQPGQPAPPWAYEYQYPVDCLRTGWLIPATQTGFAGGIPITTAVTGGAASFWQGPPVKFQVQSDTFFTVTAAAPASGGVGYAVGEVITLATPPNTSPPIGAPAQLTVTSINGTGGVTGVSVTAPGSYFTQQLGAQAQGSSTGVGLGATFTLTWAGPGPQRVILTNQEFATLVYVQQITDPNAMDTLFQRAWINLIAANVIIQLTKNIPLANAKISITNEAIAAARVADANEGLLVNDVTPDWIRVRGIDFATPYGSLYSGAEWGSLYSTFG